MEDAYLDSLYEDRYESPVYDEYPPADECDEDDEDDEDDGRDYASDDFPMYLEYDDWKEDFYDRGDEF